MSNNNSRPINRYSRLVHTMKARLEDPTDALQEYFEIRGGHFDDECQGKCNFICEYDRSIYDHEKLMGYRKLGVMHYVQED